MHHDSKNGTQNAEFLAANVENAANFDMKGFYNNLVFTKLPMRLHTLGFSVNPGQDPQSGPREERRSATIVKSIYQAYRVSL